MISGEQVVATLTELAISHVVWLPDSTLGTWEAALERAGTPRLVRVCREGEAWAIAAGLQLGGQRPLVMMQCTGLFESGDSLRNFVYDYQIPLFALIGHRNQLNPGVNDSARTFAQPILEAWQLDCVTISSAAEWPRFADHYRHCASTGRAGVVLLAEGRM